jgi:hypothetical protein
LLGTALVFHFDTLAFMERNPTRVSYHWSL